MKKLPVVLALALSVFAPAAFAEHGSAGARPLPPELLARFDTNRDGKISPEEKQAAHAARKDHRQGRREDRKDDRARGIPVATLDSNGDGYVSREEHHAAMEKMRAKIQEHKGQRQERREDRQGQRKDGRK